MNASNSSSYESVPLTELTSSHYPFGIQIPEIGEVSFENSDVTPFAQMLIEVAEALDSSGRLPAGELHPDPSKAPLITNEPESGANRRLPSGRWINIRHTKRQFIACAQDLVAVVGIAPDSVVVYTLPEE